MEHLAPWTRPPRVFVFGPECVEHEGMKRCEDHAARMYRKGEARTGDFVVMCYGERSIGCVLGRQGVPVSTDFFSALDAEYAAPRLVLPARLVPPLANPAVLFRDLFARSDYYAPAVVCLADDSALLRSLGLPPTRGHVYVFATFDNELAKCMRVDEDNEYPLMHVLDRTSDLFFTISRVPKRKMRRSGWEVVLYASHDGTAWVGCDENAGARKVAVFEEDEATVRVRALGRTAAFKQELMELTWRPEWAFQWCF